MRPMGEYPPRPASSGRTGITGNLKLPAFQAAWSELFEHLDDTTFTDLRDLRQRRGIPGPLLRGVLAPTAGNRPAGS